jgi:hypothetical protein
MACHNSGEYLIFHNDNANNSDNPINVIAQYFIEHLLQALTGHGEWHRTIKISATLLLHKTSLTFYVPW